MDWLMCQVAFNDSQLKNGVTSFPNLQIGEHLWARVAFSFHSGSVFIQIEDLTCFNQYMQFTEQDWQDFHRVEFLILPVLRILESASVFSLEQYLQLHPHSFKRDQTNPSKLILKVNSRILVGIQMPHAELKEPFVEFRYYAPPGEEEVMLGLQYKLSQNKVVFSSGLYDFFSRFVMQKLTQSGQCWKLIHSQFSRSMKEVTSQSPNNCPLFTRNPFDY